jgi:hypothetical protein
MKKCLENLLNSHLKSKLEDAQTNLNTAILGYNEQLGTSQFSSS